MRRPRSKHEALVAAVELFNRNPWTSMDLAVVASGAYGEGGFWTPHDHSFVHDERFDRAYTRAIKAGGFDYQIRWRVHTALWLAEQAARLDGAFVECGTGRGFMASAICEYLDWRDRPFYCFDTFLPQWPDESGNQEGSGCCRFYADGVEGVADNFSEWPGVKLQVGRIPEVLVDVGPVAFMHVDLNHAGAEEAAVRHFWPSLVPGGTIVFDDYGFRGHEAQKHAADRLARELGFSILSLPTGQAVASHAA